MMHTIEVGRSFHDEHRVFVSSTLVVSGAQLFDSLGWHSHDCLCNSWYVRVNGHPADVVPVDPADPDTAWEIVPIGPVSGEEEA